MTRDSARVRLSIWLEVDDPEAQPHIRVDVCDRLAESTAADDPEMSSSQRGYVDHVSRRRSKLGIA